MLPRSRRFLRRRNLPVARLAWDGLQVRQQQISVLVIGDVLCRGEGPVGELSGVGSVPGHRISAGDRLVREANVPVPYAVLLAYVKYPARVVHRGLGSP